MPRKKLRILVDADAAGESTKSGIGYYTAGLLKALAAVDKTNIEVTGHYFNFLGRGRPDLPAASNLKYKKSTLVHRKVVNGLRRLGINIPYELLAKTRADFVIFPNFTARSSMLNVPFAPVVHDLTYLDHPEFVSPKNRQDLEKFVPESLEHAAFAITVSHTSKRVLTEHYPWFDKPVVAEHTPPITSEVPSISVSEKRLGALNISTPYILFIGNLEPRKNIQGIVEAYTALPAKLREEYSLVLAGGEGWNNEDIRETMRNAQSQGLRIIETGYISELDRNVLYSNASQFVFPSFYEGYGIPIMEAMSYGVPVVASDLGVFREIAEDAILYCNPYDSNDLAKKIELSLTDFQLRKRLIRSGRLCVTKKSWDKVARSILKEIERALADSRG